MQEILDLQKKMYDVRWRSVDGDFDLLEQELIGLVEMNGFDYEFLNQLFNELYIPPYKVDILPKHLIEEEKEKEFGRPSIGITKKISLTMPEYMWDEFEKRKELWDSKTNSETLRKILEIQFSII